MAEILYPPLRTALVTRDTRVRRAIALAGMTPGDLFEFHDDLPLSTSTTPPGWQSGIAGSGVTASPLTAATPQPNAGEFLFSTGATANSVSELYGNVRVLDAAATRRWYVAARFRLHTAVDAQARMVAGLVAAGGGGSIVVGGLGGGSIANFCLGYDAAYTGALTYVDLGVAIDTARHLFEVYGKADGKIYCRVDNGSEFGGYTMASPLLRGYMLWSARNGTTPANREMTADYYTFVTER